MVHFKILPLRGVGDIELGMSMEEVVKILGEPFRFKERLCYFQNKLQIFLDVDGKVEYIDLVDSEDYTCSILGVNPFKVEPKTLIEHIGRTLESLVDNESNGTSYIAFKNALSLWRSSARDPDIKYFESIGIGSAGYYNEFR